MISTTVSQHRSALNALCEAYHVSRLDLFGSATVSNEPNDLDFLVSFQPMKPEDHADAYFGFLAALQDLFACDIDLVEESAIRNPYFKKGLEESRERLYAA